MINYYKTNDVENEIQIQLPDNFGIKDGQEFDLTIDQKGNIRLTPIKNDLEEK